MMPSPPAMTEWSVTRRLIPWFEADGDRPLPLGRHVHHDSRSLWYPYQRTAPTLVSVLHARNVPIFDQGNVGSCTGNAEEGALGTDPLFETLPAGTVLNEDGALVLYSAAEDIDGDGPYPPNDNGSSGLSVAQAAKNAGLIAGYTHCLSLADVQDALQAQPVIVGVNWYDSFDSPASNGVLTISPGASVRGGHELVLRGIDVTAKQVFGDNSWAADWGPINGSFIWGWDTLTRLLAEQGDGTVMVPLGGPVPVPVPVPPTPTPTPGPVAVDGADTALWSPAVRHWSGEHHTGDNHHAAQAIRTWARAKGLA